MPAPPPSPRRRSRDPLDALSLVLTSVDALRNTRALYMLLTTFGLAGLLTTLAQGALLAGQSTVAALQAAAALFVAFYGGSAAGILIMDDARGVPVRDAGDALRASLSSAHRLLLALLAIGALYAVLGGLLVGLMWTSRADVSGVRLGAWLFGLLVPLGVVAVGLAMLAAVAVVVPLVAPGVWAGTGATALVRQLWRWTRHRLLKVALLMAAVSLLTAGVGALVTFVVVTGARVVAQIALHVVGVDVPAAQLMAGLFGRSAGVVTSPHASAALLGESVVFAIALVLPGVVYIRGTCSVYLAMCEDSPEPSAREA